jgi:hypothetical protein
MTSDQKPYTEDDIAVVSSALEHCMCASLDERAECILDDLAANGRLLPAEAERREQLGVRVDAVHRARKEKVGDVMTHLHPDTMRAAPDLWEGWTLVKRDKIEWYGRWVEVDPSTEEPPGAHPDRRCPKCDGPLTAWNTEPHDEDWSSGYREVTATATRYEPCGCTRIRSIRPSTEEATDRG